MRRFVLLACLSLCVAVSAFAKVSITKSDHAWVLTNGEIRMELVQTAGAVQLKSLRRESGAEWAVAGAPLLAFSEKSGRDYRYVDDVISDAPKDGKALTLRFQSASGGMASLTLTLHPTGAVVEFVAHLENRGNHPLLLNPFVRTLSVTLKNPAG